MGWIEGLNDAMDYIERNLEGGLDVARAARLAACTEGQFRRMSEGGGCGLRRALRVDAALSSALPGLPPDEVCALYGFDLEARDLAVDLAGEEGWDEDRD